MSQYVTKFSLRDVAYLLDVITLNLLPVTITDIYIHETALMQPVITYRIKFINITNTGKVLYDEPSLFYLEEGKIELAKLISDRETEIGNLK